MTGINRIPTPIPKHRQPLQQRQNKNSLRQPPTPKPLQKNLSQPLIHHSPVKVTPLKEYHNEPLIKNKKGPFEGWKPSKELEEKFKRPRSKRPVFAEWIPQWRPILPIGVDSHFILLE
jgi:hypothetical protein